MIRDKSSQCPLHRLARGLQHLQPREVLVVALDERPWRGACAGALDHLVDGALVVGPLRPVAPVLVRQLPALVPGLLALLETAQLFVLRDVDPVLDQDDPVFDELFLELVDLRVRAPPSCSVAKPSTRSTSTRPYQLRSKIVTLPARDR